MSRWAREGQCPIWGSCLLLCFRTPELYPSPGALAKQKRKLSRDARKFRAVTPQLPSQQDVLTSQVCPGEQDLSRHPTRHRPRHPSPCSVSTSFCSDGRSGSDRHQHGASQLPSGTSDRQTVSAAFAACQHRNRHRNKNISIF